MNILIQEEKKILSPISCGLFPASHIFFTLLLQQHEREHYAKKYTHGSWQQFFTRITSG